ncbi:hypothetical protein Mth01_50270 [Sphaerimonospora thailandensis]|uniref:Uncharacterized protein n=1 Tax=Sphaerimonospora thailandensis TaxID=795644 RepID=A0A8J3RFG7_9ACTN|nr:hypothetical protein Mth01_50270 [Sphaerimonospora thailandensis]
MSIRSILSAATLVGGLISVCQPVYASAAGLQRDALVVTDIVDYECTADGEAEKQEIKVKVELTMPTDATAGKQMTINWRGTYFDDTTALRVPAAGLAVGTKLYAYASISGLAKLTSATGVGEIASLTPGESIPLPLAEVPLKTTSANAGTATVRPAAINFGTRPTEPTIECEVKNADDLTTYNLTIGTVDDRPADSDTASDTSSQELPSQEPADDTAIETTRNGKVSKTPSGGVATGGGGEVGPDGRVLVLTGLLLTLTAAAGLLLSRRRLSEG